MTAAERAEQVIVIEDDPSVAQLIRIYLAHEGYEALSAEDGISGLELARSSDVSLILLDLNLPGIDGIRLCEELRKDSDVPIIMVTARVEEDDRLAGLDLGADDYVVKPFSPRELMARVRAVLRRATRDPRLIEDIHGSIAVDDYSVDLKSRTAKVGDRQLNLTPTEYRLFTYFLNTHGRTVSRDQIIECAIGYEFEGIDRTIDTHVSNLRRKLETANGSQRHLKTVYGAGYRFETS